MTMPNTPLAADPDALLLPPLFTLVTLREVGDAFAHACAIAPDAGAGTLVWVRRYDIVEVAVVLEPEEALPGALCAAFVGMNALADTLAAHCPPEKEVEIGWPVTLRFNRARIGGGRLAVAPGAGDGDVPDWLVFGGMLIADSLDPTAPGRTPETTSLFEEGFADVETPRMVESFARHLMAGFHTWSERGFRHVARTYLERLQGAEPGVRRGIDVNGDLLLRRCEDTQRVPLRSLVDGSEWYDADRREPRL
ncbi:biotin/lipoate--protein ligase family protein [Alsobacter sp. R-9]